MYVVCTAGRYAPLHVGSTQCGFVLTVMAALHIASQAKMMAVTALDCGTSSRVDFQLMYSHYLYDYKDLL